MSRSPRKQNLKFTFTVEGHTEKWYLDWLRCKINEHPNAQYKVEIESKIEKSPFDFVKRKNNITTPEIAHICDIESNNDEHRKNFEKVLAELKKAHDDKFIDCQLGYSNFTFELWMILHKIDCKVSLADRKQYLRYVNRAFNKSYSTLDEFKGERNFKSCLEQLTINDVINAINRSEQIMKDNKENGLKLKRKYGFSYYEENPSLSIHNLIKNILTQCGII